MRAASTGQPLLRNVEGIQFPSDSLRSRARETIESRVARTRERAPFVFRVPDTPSFASNAIRPSRSRPRSERNEKRPLGNTYVCLLLIEGSVSRAMLENRPIIDTRSTGREFVSILGTLSRRERGERCLSNRSAKPYDGRPRSIRGDSRSQDLSRLVSFETSGFAISR